jgi:hypothetical protein
VDVVVDEGWDWQGCLLDLDRSVKHRGQIPVVITLAMGCCLVKEVTCLDYHDSREIQLDYVARDPSIWSEVWVILLLNQSLVEQERRLRIQVGLYQLYCVGHSVSYRYR